jgi:hypothetical protein
MARFFYLTLIELIILYIRLNQKCIYEKNCFVGVSRLVES